MCLPSSKWPATCAAGRDPSDFGSAGEEKEEGHCPSCAILTIGPDHLAGTQTKVTAKKEREGNDTPPPILLPAFPFVSSSAQRHIRDGKHRNSYPFSLSTSSTACSSSPGVASPALPAGRLSPCSNGGLDDTTRARSGVVFRTVISVMGTLGREL